MAWQRCSANSPPGQPSNGSSLAWALARGSSWTTCMGQPGGWARLIGFVSEEPVAVGLPLWCFSRRLW